MTGVGWLKYEELSLARLMGAEGAQEARAAMIGRRRSSFFMELIASSKVWKFPFPGKL